MAQKKRKSEPVQAAGKGPDTRFPSWLEKGARFELALTGFLLLALVVYFREFIFNSQNMLAGHDMITQGLQTRKLGIEAVKSGQGLPLWNSYSYCGILYLGFLPGPLFLPTTLLYYLLPIERAIGYSFVIMMLAGGLFTYFWIRELGLARAAAALCAVAYCFTGWVASCLAGGHDGRMLVILVTPLVFFCLERGLKRRKLVYFLLMGAGVALQILSPQVQMMYFSSLALSAFFLFRLILLYRERTPLSTLAGLLLKYAFGFALAVSLSAVQFAPLLSNQKYSHRQLGTGLGYEGYEHATQFSMHPLETLGLVVPGFTGEPNYYWGAESFKGHSEYMGLLPLFFAAVALACRRNRYTWFFTGLGGLALLFNFGGYTPFYKLPYYLLPEVKLFRGPNMMFFVTAFSVITLAGYGLDAFLSGGRAEEKVGGYGTRTFKTLAWAAAAVLLILLVLGLGKNGLPQVLSGMIPDPMGKGRLPTLVKFYPQIIKSAFISAVLGGVILALAWLWRRGSLSLTALVALLAALTFGDLLRMDHNWLSVVNTGQYYYRDKLVERLEQEKEPYRVFFYPTPGTADLWDNSLLYFRIPTINASMPLRLKWYEELMGTHQFLNLVRYPRLWNLLNARFVIFRKNDYSASFENAFSFLRKIEEDDLSAKVLYENPAAWPRFKLFSQYEVIEDDKSFMPRFNDPQFEPRTTLILSEKPEFDPSSLDAALPVGEKIALERYGNDELELSVDYGSASLLFLAETWHPDWQATVDGRPAKIYRANLAMRAVYLEPGAHKVVMRYVSASYLWGKRLSLLGLLALVAAVGWTFYRKDW